MSVKESSNYCDKASKLCNPAQDLLRLFALHFVPDIIKRLMSYNTGSEAATLSSADISQSEFAGDCGGQGTWYPLVHNESDGGSSWLHTIGDPPPSMEGVQGWSCGQTHGGTCPYAKPATSSAGFNAGTASIPSAVFTPAPPTEQDPQQGLVHTPAGFASNWFPIEPRARTPDLLRDFDVGKMRRAFAEDHIRRQLGMLTDNLKRGEWSLETRHRMVNDLIDSVLTDVLDSETESPRVGWKIYQGGKEAPGPDTVIEWVFGWPLEGTSEEANVEGADSKSTMKAKIIAGLQSANLWRDA
jgi:hypothetical protein